MIERSAHDLRVIKNSGAVETLNLDKLRSSLTRSGADRVQADEIIERMLEDLGPETSTKKIYRLARKYLKKFNHASGLRRPWGVPGGDSRVAGGDRGAAR